MMVRRLWLDADGQPHVEEITFQPADDGEIITAGDGEVIGQLIMGPVVPVGIADPAAGGGITTVAALYGPLPEGVAIVGHQAWQNAVDTGRADREAALAAALAPTGPTLEERIAQLEALQGKA